MKKYLRLLMSFIVVMFISFTFNSKSNIAYAWETYNLTVKVSIDNADEYKEIDHKIDQALVWISDSKVKYYLDNLPTVTENYPYKFSLKNNQERTFKYYIEDNQLKTFDVRPYNNSDYHYSLDYIEYKENTKGYIFNENTDYEISVKTGFEFEENTNDGTVVLHYTYHPDINPIEKEPPNPVCTKKVDYLGDGHKNEDTSNNGKNDYRMYLDFFTQKDEDSNKANVVFIADVSGSMGGSTLDKFKNILKDNFKKLLENPDNKISLITFSDESKILASQSNDINFLNKTVDGLVADGHTNYYKGLTCTQQELKNINANKDDDRETILVFITDGNPDKSISGYSLQNFSGVAYGHDIASKLQGVSRFFSIYMSTGSKGATNLQNLTQYVNTSKPNEKIMVQARRDQDIRYALDEFFKRLGNGLSNASIVDDFSDYVELDTNPDYKATAVKDGKVTKLIKNKDYVVEPSRTGVRFRLLIPTIAQTKYTFSYNVRPSNMAFDYRYKHQNFPNTGDENTDYNENKTSSLKQGLFAQDNTKLTFNYGKGDYLEKEYPKPVIQVLKPDAIDIPIMLRKQLQGQTLKEDMFSFSLCDKNGRLIETQKNDDYGNINFGSVVVDMPGRYSFVAKEDIPLQKGTYTYDESKKNIDVSVRRVGDDLKASVSYPKERTFKNKYTPRPTFVTLTANKVLERGTLKNNQFNFKVADHEGTVVASTSNNANGKVVFSPLKFTKPGKYNYKIYEVVPNPPDANMYYDPLTIKVLVEVEDKNGHLVAKVDYSDDITFNNKLIYKPITAGIETEVVLTGMQLSTGMFNFELVDQDTKESFKASNNIDGKIIFNCRYTTVGEHKYKVRQVMPEKPMKNMIYDDEEITLNVKIVDKGNGIIKPVVQAENKSKFFNSYKTLGEIW